MTTHAAAPTRSPLLLLLSGSGPLLVLSVLAGGLHYAFQVLMGRMLGPVAFADVGLFLSVAALLTMPLGALQPTVAYATAASPPPAREDARWRRVDAGTLALCVLSLAAAPLLLRIPARAALVATLVLVGALGALTLVYSGAFQGRKRFVLVGALVLGGALVKLVVGVWLVGGSLDPRGAFYAPIAGGAALLAVAALAAPLRRHESLAPRDVLLGPRLGSAVAGLLLVAALQYGDAWVAATRLAAAEAGTYLGVAALAKIALFVPAVVGTVALPHVAGVRDALRRRRVVVAASLATLAAVGGFALLFGTLGERAVTLLLGDGYVVPTRLALALSAALVPASLLQILVLCALATESPWSVLAAVPGALAGLLVLVALPPSAVAVALAVAASSLLACAGLAVALTRGALRATPSPR